MNYLYGFLSYISFKLNMPTFTRGFFKKSLSMVIGKKEPAVSLFVRSANHAPLLEIIERVNVNNEYKAYLKAVVHRHERNYKKAYQYIANDNNVNIIDFKVRLLYDLKDFKEIVELSKQGHDVLTNLNESQQRTLIKYLVSRNNFADAESILRNASDINESLYEDFESAKSDIFYKYNWNQYKNNILELTDIEYDDISEYKSHIDEKKDEMQNMGYVTIINHHFDRNGTEEILNEHYVPYINAEQHLLQYIDPAAVYKLNFNIEDETDESLQLQNALNRLYIGDKSKKLIQDIIKNIHITQLNHQHIFSIRRLIIEGRFDLSDQTVRALFKEERKLEPVFYNVNMFTDPSNRDEVDGFVHDEFNKKQKKRIYSFVAKQLHNMDDTNILPKHIIKYLESTDAKFSHSTALAKQYYLTDQTHKVDVLVQSKTKDRQLKMHIQLAKFLFNTKNYNQSLKEIEKAYDIKPNNPDVLRGLIRAHHILGGITKRYEFLVKMKRYAPARIFPGELQMAEQEYRLLNEHWQLPENLSHIQAEQHGNKILYVLNKALPAVNGYTIRSNEIIKRVKDKGYTPVITTRLGWSPVHENYEIPEKNINDIETYYIDKSDRYLTNKTPILKYFDAYAIEIKNIIEKERPSIIHAASNFQNALPALKLGKSMNIKTIYEVRGMWHHTQSSKIEGFLNSDRFNLQEQQEFHCCHTADQVVCISQSLKKYLIEHGIEESKITVIPNGVDTTAIAPLQKDGELIKKYNLDQYHVLGFIGSITSYEGLDLVIEAVHELNKDNKLDKKFKLLIVGDGQHRSHLQKLVNELDLQEYVIFTGRVPHTEIARYYSVMDIAPFARTNDLVCQLVTPLKTYEAMAMEKKVIVSDIPALREMVIENENGLVFKAEDRESLMEAVLNIIEDKDLTHNARAWVSENRDWRNIIEQLNVIYKKF